MLTDVRAWLKSHPDFQPTIQYNFTEKTCVIASLAQAIKEHFVSVNDYAFIMFNELGWLEDNPFMPTVLMVKAVMDHALKEKE